MLIKSTISSIYTNIKQTADDINRWWSKYCHTTWYIVFEDVDCVQILTSGLAVADETRDVDGLCGKQKALCVTLLNCWRMEAAGVLLMPVFVRTTGDTYRSWSCRSLIVALTHRHTMLAHRWGISYTCQLHGFSDAVTLSPPDTLETWNSYLVYTTSTKHNTTHDDLFKVVICMYIPSILSFYILLRYERHFFFWFYEGLYVHF